MKNHDRIQRFLFEDEPIRGQLVSLDNSWQTILQKSDAEGYAREILGHALAAVALLSSTLKFDGNITLQIRGQGPLHMLVAQATSDRTLRGIIRQSHAIEDETASLADIFQSDKMVITIDSGKGKPHQGIVPLSGHTLSEALGAYFEQSEQLQTHLWLACNDDNASGLLIQKLPGEPHDPDAWERILQLSETITDNELYGLDSQELIYRLFHEESVRVFEQQPVSFQCSCSRERTSSMLKSLGKAELEDILKTEDSIGITCEFCNEHYSFDAIDVESLFNDRISESVSSKTHH
jgi:molecular chaperone Hsp33